ncbi:3-hydroxyisobutyrate dehydrogenase [Roseovarius pacificus]|uniref:3-hydroxyisobutyrate dehydrogenase n=1 Tax=Roseovarius pacificus TaxID=337701 RepID=A0A1M7AH87_9RHOB|nr:NAD(P)-dependent oxidoreductase [Roseovarius pacificus]GGO53462.1 2-hydroxy-3-oxopropionate reductase [Roseovarius pacificus]SHL42034.1 3-hydroxyisobutyrate dehydrogenase [Roseovarius pacificus]
MNKNCVGLIGIGMMGEPMARNIAAAGFDLVLCDADRGKATGLAEEIGARACATPVELARETRMVITMLPNSAVVGEVLFGENGFASAAQAGTLVVDMSSGDPHATIGFGERLADAKIRMIDAPVSGGVPRARAGTLTIMVGGDETAFGEAESVLNAMGCPTHVGIFGAGQAMKALNNLVSAGGFLIGIEALLIGQKFGLSPDVMVDILNSSSGMNNSTKNKFRQYVLSRDFDAGGFAISLMAKDVGIAMNVAHATGTPAPFAAHCADAWAAASNMLGAKADHTAITRMCEAFAGIELKKTDQEAAQ